MSEEKYHFIMPTRGSAPATEFRVSGALEYIAHYLERIDGHLERLVKVTELNSGGVPMVAKELAELRIAIQLAAEKR